MTQRFAPARRRHLIGLTALPLVGCASRAPLPPPPAPTRIGLLPIPEIVAVSLYYSRQTKAGVGMILGGIGALAMAGSERGISKQLTERLAKEGFAPAARLRSGVLAALDKAGGKASPIDDAARTAAPIKAWRFESLKAEADGVLWLELEEVAISTEGQSTLYPKISASMRLLSTTDNQEIGSASYYLGIDADRTNTRHLRPWTRDKFESTDQVLADPGRAARSLNDGIDRLAQLIAADTVSLQRGVAIE